MCCVANIKSYVYLLNEKRDEMDFSNVTSILMWIMPIIIVSFWGVVLYALILLIKALRIYIKKNSY